MKEQKYKSVITKIVFIIVGITSIFLLTINFVPVFVIDAGIERRFIDDIYSDSGAYVNKSNPDTNYAYTDGYYIYPYLYIGKFSEIYIHFDLELLPKRTEETYFFLTDFKFDNYFESPVDDFEINVILVESNWTASDITWNIKPKHEEIIATVNISEITQSPYITRKNFKRAINITEILKEDELKEISICLNITENSEKLNASAYIEGFGIIWTYERIILSYTPIISTFIILPMLLVVLYLLRKDLINCRECGTKRVLEDKYCRSCGLAFKEKILIKSRDYQLILIILLIFVFLEVSFVSIFFGVITGPYMLFLAIPILLWLIFWWLQIKKQIKKQMIKYKKLKSSLKQTKKS